MLKLLYVDDDDDIRELATFSLALDPHIEVTIAASGADALQVIGKTRFDAVLLDVMMPEMDGPGVLAAMRQRFTDKTPVFEFNGPQSLASRANIEAFLKKSGAQLWIEHDLQLFRGLKTAPEYLE